MGRVGGKPEITVTPTGKKRARLYLVSKVTYWNTAGKRTTEMQCHILIAWGALAEMAGKYLSNGKDIAVEGKLINRSYTDKQGIKSNATEILLSNLSLRKA